MDRSTPRRRPRAGTAMRAVVVAVTAAAVVVAVAVAVAVVVVVVLHLWGKRWMGLRNKALERILPLGSQQ